MSNSIIATIPFDFKGVSHTPSVKIDLDDFIENGKELSDIYLAVSMQNQIGHYSYEHEIFLSSDIIFSQPEGMAQQYFNGSDFELDRFKQSYHEKKLFHALEAIAREHLQVDDLEQNANLKRALLAAYNYARETI